MNPTITDPSSLKFLEIKSLAKAYRTSNTEEYLVLSDINLSIGTGEYISIIGHSGCGKSTLLRIVAGLEKATSGSIYLDGREIRNPSSERMMVFQQHALLPWLTVRENVQLAVDEVMKNTSLHEKKQIVSEHLEMVNLSAAANKYPDELSGGMKQRVGIARALSIRPKVLLMDEPFGALDALTRYKLQQQVLKIWEAHRLSVIMITHDVDEAIFMSDRIVMMTNSPAAHIGEVLDVPFPHPRDRAAIRTNSDYFELRNHILNFLDQYSTYDE